MSAATPGRWCPNAGLASARRWLTRVRPFVPDLLKAPRPEIKYVCVFESVRMHPVRVAKDSDVQTVVVNPLGRLKIAVTSEFGFRNSVSGEQICN